MKQTSTWARVVFVGEVPDSNMESLWGIWCLRGLGSMKDCRAGYRPHATEAFWAGCAQSITKGTLASYCVHKHVHQLQPLGNGLC